MNFKKLTEIPTQNLSEGDYVVLKLNKRFLTKLIKDKQKMYEEFAKGPQKGKAPVGTMAPASSRKGSVPTVPEPPKIDPPGFVIGQVSENLPDLVYLVSAYEERSKEPVKKGYETRELVSAFKITEAQYREMIQELT